LVAESVESEAAHDAWFAANVAPTMLVDFSPPNVPFRPMVDVAIA
jgi:hypothetical protein